MIFEYVLIIIFPAVKWCPGSAHRLPAQLFIYIRAAVPKLQRTPGLSVGLVTSHSSGPHPPPPVSDPVGLGGAWDLTSLCSSQVKPVCWAAEGWSICKEGLQAAPSRDPEKHLSPAPRSQLRNNASEGRSGQSRPRAFIRLSVLVA